MAAPTPPDFDAILGTTGPQQPSVRERGASASAQLEEAKVPTAPRRAEADTARAEAAAERERLRLEEELRERELAGEAEAGAEEEARRASMRQREKNLNYIGTIQRAKDLIGGGRAMGPIGQITKQAWSSDAAGLEAILTSVANPIVLEAMQEARKGSKAGATGFGALSERELDLLKASWGSLKQSQKPEDLLRVLNNIERHYRRFMAYNAGYDPDSVEGAVLVGLAPPEGSVPPPVGEVGPRSKQEEDPEIAGLRAAGAAMIKAGRSPEQIRQWYNEYRPGLGDSLEGIEETVAYWNDVGKAKGEEPIVVMGPSAEEAEPTLLGRAADTPVGAALVAAADQFGLGYLDELNPFADPEVSSAISRGLREKYPRATVVGDVAGGIGSAVGGTALAGRLGLRGAPMLEGVAQEFVRGTGLAEPGQRLEGGVEQAIYGLGGNIAGRFAGDIIGGAFRGADPDARILTEKYGIDLTPGQLSGNVARERSVAGIPIAGPQVQARRNESLAQFNKAAFDDALAPLGTQVDTVGQKGIEQAQEVVSTAYREALDPVFVQFDQPFSQAIRGKPYNNLLKLRDIGPELAQQVDDIVQRYTVGGTGMTGEGLQNALQEIETLSRSYKQDPRWANRIKPALDDISDGVSGLLERQFPENFERFVDANTAYRNLSILENAVTRASSEGGTLFGPSTLRSATSQGTNRFGGKRANARGDRPFNELVMSSLDRIPEKTGDASLFGRIVGPSAVGGGVGTGVALTQMGGSDDPRESDGSVPAWMLGGMGAAALAAIPYSKAGVRVRSGALTGPRTQGQRTLGQMLTEYGGSLGRGLTAAFTADPDAPLPQNFDYDNMGSPEFKRILKEVAEQGEALSPDERRELYREMGLGSTFRDVDAAGDELDPETGLPIRERFNLGGMVRKYQEGGPVLRDRTRAVGQGVTFGFGDEIEGGIRALGGAISEGDLMALRRKYIKERDLVRAQQRAYEEANPIESLLLEGGGAMLTGFVPGAQGATAARMAQLAARSPKAARAASVAADTALYGAGTADSVRDIPRSIRDEALFAVPMYGAAEGVRAGVKRYKRRKKK